jgi:hypothetical protein
MSNPKRALETVMGSAIRSQMRRVRVALPGVITEYDASTCQATVQPSIQDSAYTEYGVFAERIPAIPHVPVLFVGGGGSRLTFPVAVGDSCLVVFASSSLEKWLALGGEVYPDDDRHHDLTDAIAIVGLSDFAHVASASATAAVLEGNDIRLADQGATEPALKSNAFMTALDTFITSLATAINAIAGGGPAAATAITTAKGVLDAAATGFKSTKVKVGG